MPILKTLLNQREKLSRTYVTESDAKVVISLRSLIRSLGIFNIDLTIKRLLNLLKIYSSLFVSKVSRRQMVWGYPIFLMVEPTNICNLKCPMCPAGNGDMRRSLGKLDIENYRKLLDDIGDYILQVQLWNQGEPFINELFLEFVRYAKLKGIMVETSTNGHFIRNDEEAENLIRSGLDQIIFSMDGTNKESYERYRVGGNFDLVLDTLDRISRVKSRLNRKTPLVELQFIIFKHNQEEIEKIIEICKKFNLNRISFKTAQVYSSDQALTYLPDDEKYRRYVYDGHDYAMKGRIKNWCNRLWLNSTVNWDGSVSPCCFDKDADFAFDNIFVNNSTFTSTWKNKAYMAFRKKVMSSRRSIEMCNNCTEGLKEPYARIIEIKDL